MPEAEVITNDHHDEEVSISDAESVPDQGGGDSDPSDADDDAGARGKGPGPPALSSHRTLPPGEMLCARVRACAACAPVMLYSLNAVRACAAAAGQQSNEESIEFGDEDESRDDGSPGKRPKGQVLCARQPRPPAAPTLADAPRDLATGIAMAQRRAATQACSDPRPDADPTTLLVTNPKPETKPN